jgi:hypothetical protein
MFTRPPTGFSPVTRPDDKVWRPETCRLFSEHPTSEYRVKTGGRGRKVDEWQMKPGGGDNHWLDCLVGAVVAASLQGSALSEHAPSGWARCPRRLPRPARL